MKSFLLIVALVALNFAQARTRKAVDCEATEVFNTSYLEESLSVEEYPKVTLQQDETGSLEAWLGSSLYKAEDGDLIQGEPTVGFNQTFSIKPSHKLHQFLLHVSAGREGKTGTLFGQERKSVSKKFGTLELIANLKCK